MCGVVLVQLPKPHGQDRIGITQDNELSWLCECSVVSFDIPLTVEHHATVNKALGISLGDTIWVSRRHSAVEVGSAQTVARSPIPH